MNRHDVANANGMKRLEAMLDAVIARDADASAQAQKRAAKRREKYGEHAVSAHARFTPVAKGSVPIRTTLAGTRFERLPRRHRRRIERAVGKRKEAM